MAPWIFAWMASAVADMVARIAVWWSAGPPTIPARCDGILSLSLRRATADEEVDVPQTAPGAEKEAAE